MVDKPDMVDKYNMTDASQETLDIYEDEDGNEFVLIDGTFVPFDESQYEVVDAFAADEAGSASAAGEAAGDSAGSELGNPFDYDSVQVATDVANHVARDGVTLARDGMALAGELKEAMDDITSLLNPKSGLK